MAHKHTKKAYIDSNGNVEDGNGIPLSNEFFESFMLGNFGNAGTHFIGGFYDAPASDAVLTIGGTITQTHGIAGRMYAAHAFIVASGAGGADLVLTVTGVSIADDGTRNDADSEVIVLDADTAIANQYFETTKKWLGQVTFTLTGAAGSFTFNYGFAKYNDFGNVDFTVTDFEMVLHGGASETGFDIQLLHHNSAGWTYHATAFIPGDGNICSSLTDYSATNDNFASGDFVSYKRAGLSTDVIGSDSEGIIIKVITETNNSVQHGTVHIGAQLTPPA